MNAQTTNTSFLFWSAAESRDTSSTNADNRHRCLSLLFLGASRAHAGTDVNINDRKDETQGAGTVADLVMREQNQLRSASWCYYSKNCFQRKTQFPRSAMTEWRVKQAPEQQLLRVVNSKLQLLQENFEQPHNFPFMARHIASVKTAQVRVDGHLWLPTWCVCHKSMLAFDCQYATRGGTQGSTDPSWDSCTGV